VTDDEKLILQLIRVIHGLDGLLVSYRTGRRPSEAALRAAESRDAVVDRAAARLEKGELLR
jgi:DNA-binding cell septation regulator SpoVG